MELSIIWAHLWSVAVDKISVTLTTLSIPFLFMKTDVTFWLGISVMGSTLAYNGIRIAKELWEVFKNRKKK